MADDKKLEELVLTRLIRLNAVVQGLVTGALVGLAIFVVTNWLILKGGPIGSEGTGHRATSFPPRAIFLRLSGDFFGKFGRSCLRVRFWLCHRVFGRQNLQLGGRFARGQTARP